MILVDSLLLFYIEPLYLLFELAANGNLLNLLRQQRRAFSPNNFDENYLKTRHERHFNLTLQDLMKFALQVASGLDYISSHQVLMVLLLCQLLSVVSKLLHTNV